MLKVLFMGTPEFARVILEGLVTQYDVIGVVTQPDKVVGRKKELKPSPVKEFATTHNIKVYQPQKIRKEADELIALKPDLIVTAAYGQIIGTNLLDAPKYHCINVHGSLLPKYRGGAPIQRAIMNGEKETGITIMYMSKGMDSGDILAQRTVKIDDCETTTTLFSKMAIAGRDLLLESLPDILSGKIKPLPQKEEDVTFGYNLTREEERIDFTKDAQAVDCQIRALLDEPGAYFNFIGFPEEKDLIKVLEAKPSLAKVDAIPGTVVSVNKQYFTIACGNHTAIQIYKVKPFGKKAMDAQSFINGAMRRYYKGE